MVKYMLTRYSVDYLVFIHEDAFLICLGKQPIMVAGMTPSTVHGGFVAACINAGYHVELAGGGHYNESALRQKVQYIVDNVSAGQGISINVLFINQRQWGFQFPLVQVLRKEGVAVDGFCVAAGVPSLEVANEIIQSLLASGIRHVSFKPGSTEGIMQVITIAKHNPDCPIIMQWTGGRAGGHHSYEDFHQPILDTYALIRSCDNICIVAGSGFGDGVGTFPYIDGSWSKAFNYPAMPFDGILLGSRMMVAKEGNASPSVKETIVEVAGVNSEKEWVKSYKGQAGGVVTVISELGEPIHKIATRGVLFWKELDETVFKLPRDKRLAYLNNNRDYIIQRLNADSQKVWFGKNSSGVAVELDEMTYEEVLGRMADLLYVNHQKRWIDKSFRKLFFEFLQRAEERLVQGPVPSCIPSAIDLESSPKIDPHEFLGHLKVDASFDLNHLMSSDDCLYFVSLCRRPGQKPVPFIPLFDENFETWFKKDSLWQAEDIDAVVGQDPQRVCILQGPVAAKYCTKTDEPVKSILDGIMDFHIEHILTDYYDGDSKKLPVVEWFSSSAKVKGPIDPVQLGAVREDDVQKDNLHKDDNLRKDPSTLVKLTIPFEATLPSEDDWYQSLCSGNQSWLSALLLSTNIVQNKNLVPNAVKRLFAPRSGYSYTFDKFEKPNLVTVSVKGKELVKASYGDGIIKIDVNYFGSQGSSLLESKYQFKPECSGYLIHEVMDRRNELIKCFYWNLWFPNEPASEFKNTLGLDPLSAKFNSVAKVETDGVGKFCRVVGNHSGAYAEQTNGRRYAPMDFAIVVAWKSVIKCIFPSKVDGDLLQLVHLSNRISYVDKARPLKAGDLVETEAQISSIKWTLTGKIVEVDAISCVEGKPVLRVLSKFMYRGVFDKNDLYFDKGKSIVKKLVIDSTEDLAVFRSKNWINWSTDKSMERVQIGSILLLELDYLHLEDVNNRTLKKIECTGTLSLKTDTKEYSRIGSIDFYSVGPMKSNPVLHYLDRHSHTFDTPTSFDNEIPISTETELLITTSNSNQTYSDVSGDHNPIHTDMLIADLVSLPGTITHGMWTSAAVRSIVETYAAENQALRVRDYEAMFDNMVLPNDKLQVRLYHVGMKGGHKLVKIETRNQQGDLVMHGVAEIEQPRTAYVFTGQGSQEVGMGMDLYKSSKVAKEIWDIADNHFFYKYGFSILHIVKNNPKSLTVYFGGPRGQMIKENYRSMTYETNNDDGTTKSVSLFPSITEFSTFFTFSSPNGLLFATQFTQPALTLMEKAAYEDMRHRGLAGSGDTFAGHSLGEYAALASVGDVLSIETLCDVVFYRGLSMQVAVERDSLGRSNYGMTAVNPTRVGSSFDDKALRELVPLVAYTCGRLLEIVNYNVEDWQYVVAGDLEALETLTSMLNYIASQKFDIKKLMVEMGEQKIRENLTLMVKEAFTRTMDRKELNGHLVLERGIATIPLVGIDVPFHSSFLLGGVPSFRKCLENKIKTSSVDPNILRGNYIPNLTGLPFDTTIDYAKIVFEKSNSPILKEIIGSWKSDNLTAAESQKLARSILIELLAYQFASPVRWIETQDVLFKNFATERLIEIGPTPVLSGMAERTLKIKYQEYDDALNQSRTLWSYTKHKTEIYYDYTPAVSKETSPLETKEESTIVKNVVPQVLNSPVRAPSKRYEDLPVEPEELLRILVAIKTKLPIDKVPPSKSIKDLSGGKSTLQNEILADLQKEFGESVPERSEELSLKDLGAHIKPAFSRQPGKFTSTILAKLFTAKMPAGFTANTAKDLLDKEFGLSPKASDQLLLYRYEDEIVIKLIFLVFI